MPCRPQEACFSQIRNGLHAYHSSLAAVLELLPSHAGLVETLQLDAANLSSNIQQQVRGRRGGGARRGDAPPGDTGTRGSSGHRHGTAAVAALRGCSWPRG